eukprot:359985-Chlamydomonas_euryale.AAC.11
MPRRASAPHHADARLAAAPDAAPRRACHGRVARAEVTARALGSILRIGWAHQQRSRGPAMTAVKRRDVTAAHEPAATTLEEHAQPDAPQTSPRASTVAHAAWHRAKLLGDQVTRHQQQHRAANRRTRRHALDAPSQGCDGVSSGMRAAGDFDTASGAWHSTQPG